MIKIGDIILDRYEIIQRIGMGGMADVYKARDGRLGRFVAIKVLKSEFCQDRSFVVKFQAEARAAAGLSHPNIVNVYDVAEENDSYFIIMELVEGITLKKYIERKGKLSAQETISIAIQVATGIEAAHNNNIIHRDIKPQNIIISQEGKVKIADFGIAKAISASTSTLSTNVMGSVHYSSPEQSRGGYLDAKSDIYSLGIVMYEMITGRVPFDGDTTVSVAIKHLQEQMIPPSEYAEVPIALEKIILKSTQKSPELRYMNMAELIKDLKQALLTPNDDFVELKEQSGQNTVLLGNNVDDLVPNSKRYGNYNKNNISRNNAMNDRRKRKNNDNREREGGTKAETIMGIITIAAAIAIVIIVISIVLKLNTSNRIQEQPDVTNTTAQDSTENNDNSINDENQQEDNLNTDIDLPDVVGQSIDTATKMLQDRGLVVITEKDTNKDGTPDIVISQSPSAGSKLKQGDTVQLTYISAKEKDIIPKGISGMSEEEATNRLKELGFVVRPEFVYSDDIENGRVVGTNPKEGSEIDKGGNVKLLISKGIEVVKVPKLDGMTVSAATKALTTAKLSIGNIIKEYNNSVPKGKVIAQSVESNNRVNKGTKIDITISNGVSPNPLPDGEDKAENMNWLWTGRIATPVGYNGGQVKIVVEQNNGGNKVDNVVWDGKPIDFDNQKFSIEAPIPGVIEGKLIMYEKNSDGHYTQIGTAPITFSQDN